MSRFSDEVRKRVSRHDGGTEAARAEEAKDASGSAEGSRKATSGDVIEQATERAGSQAEVREAVRQEAEAQSPPTGMNSSRLLPVLIGLACIGLSLSLMHTYASLLAPIFLTLNLMITAYPAYRFMATHRIPRALAATLTGLMVIAVLALFMYGMYWSIQSMVNKLPEYSDQFNEFYKQAIDQLSRLGLEEKTLESQIKTIDPKSVAGFAAGLLSNVSSVGSMILVILTALIFMMMDTPEISERMKLARASHGGFVDSLGAFAQGIRRYWVVTTVFGLIVAILDGAVLIGLGVPLALVWAIFSFLTNYIPNIGFVIGLVPPALLALVDSGPKTAIAVVVAYSVLNFVVQSIIQPKFAGNAVGLTPTLSFISLLLWTAVMGPLGALLALPMSLLVKAMLVDPDPNTRWVNALISSRPQDAVDPEPVINPTYTRHVD